MVSFEQHTLSNGLHLLAEVNDAAHTAAIGFFVRTGARDEAAPLMGVSHFLEHMMFKGTARRSADDVNREFDEIGAHYNAFTSHEQTVYYAQVLPEFLPRATDLLADMMRPSLRDDDFEMEKKVILEEIGMYEDRPEWRLQDQLLENHFGGHGLGFRVLGTGGAGGTVTGLGVGQMRAYFSARYSPDNIVVAAAGRVDVAAVLADLRRLCGDWEATGAGRDVAVPVSGGQRMAVQDAKLARHYLGLLCPAPSAQDEDRFVARVLADVLGDDDGSRLYWALVDPGLAEEADFDFQPLDGTGAFMGFAMCDPDRAEAVEGRLLEVIDAVARDRDVTEDEVARARNKLATQATLQGERPMGRMHAIGSAWTYLGRYRSLDEELAALMAVTADDVAGFLARYPLSPRTILTLGPGARARRAATD